MGQQVKRPTKYFQKFKDKRFDYYYSKRIISLKLETSTRKCKGNLIAFLDVDDWWHKEKLSQQVSV